MFKSKITQTSLLLSLTIVGLMWAVFSFDYLLDLGLARFGVYPLKAKGLVGILTSPFIHSTRDFGHIMNNSLPMFILTWLTFYHYREIATKSLVIIYLMTGIGVWLLGRESYHIGMSGVIYGLTSFLVFSGFFRKNMRVASISLVVIFLYGSTVWGIFPIKENISWEGHAMGLFAGIIAAVLFRKAPPQEGKMRYEIEEELGIEPDHDLWKGETQMPPPQQGNIIINYTIVPKSPQVEDVPAKEVDEEE